MFWLHFHSAGFYFFFTVLLIHTIHIFFSRSFILFVVIFSGSVYRWFRLCYWFSIPLIFRSLSVCVCVHFFLFFWNMDLTFRSLSQQQTVKKQIKPKKIKSFFFCSTWVLVPFRDRFSFLLLPFLFLSVCFPHSVFFRLFVCFNLLAFCFDTMHLTCAHWIPNRQHSFVIVSVCVCEFVLAAIRFGLRSLRAY